MKQLDAMRVFVAVADAGSFVGAAEALVLSKAAVSRHVADLETHLGVRLMHRTTRRLSLTPEGELFCARCKALLLGVEEAEAEVTARSGVVRGLLRIAAPLSFGRLHLAPVWADVMSRHPQLSLDITLSDRVVDLVEDGYDLAVRIGQLPDSSLISRPLAQTRLVLCASPDYLRQHGAPQHPQELLSHDVVSYSLFASGDHWRFEGPDGPVAVTVRPRMRSNNGDTCLLAAVHHQGIVLQPSFLVADDLRAGRLVELLPAYRAPTLGIHAVHPSRQHVSAKVRLLIDRLVETFTVPPWADEYRSLERAASD